MVKLIRTGGWAAFESLVVGKCGLNDSSTNIIAVDHDTGYQYVFTKFNGRATGTT